MEAEINIRGALIGVSAKLAALAELTVLVKRTKASHFEVMRTRVMSGLGVASDRRMTRNIMDISFKAVTNSQ